MDKNLLIRILKRTPVSPEELTKFVCDYVTEEKGKEPTPEELKGIMHLINVRAFNLHYVIIKCAEKLNLQLVTVTDKNGIILRIDVYDLV